MLEYPLAPSQFLFYQTNLLPLEAAGSDLNLLPGLTGFLFAGLSSPFLLEDLANLVGR